MAVISPNLAPEATLLRDTNTAADARVETIKLTPPLVLAASVVYMMSADGQATAQESSQLQSIIGGHTDLLNFALLYTQLVPIEEFLSQAPEVLSQKDKLCILCNLCDSMYSDGLADPQEQAIFTQFLKAFGVSSSMFEAYLSTFVLKNNRSTLGHFAGLETEGSDKSPHAALAIALLYMMAADGVIGTEEIGQLESIVGEFEGLQKFALAYVQSNKCAYFLQTISPYLNPQQKLFILTNVCDSMLSDGVVASNEDKLFLSMLHAFGYSEQTFQKHHLALETKQFKPFDIRKFKLSEQHKRLLDKASADSEIFDREIANNSNIQKADTAFNAANQADWRDPHKHDAIGSSIKKTMQDNMVQTEQDFGDQKNIAKISDNATNHLNRQTLEASASNANKQTIEAQQQATNKQLIEDAQVEKNVQLIKAGHALNSDRIGLPVDQYSDEYAPRPTGVRIDNLYVDIDTLRRKLDHFELRNKKFLQEASAYKIVVLENDIKVEPFQTQPQLPSVMAENHAQTQRQASVNQGPRANPSTSRVNLKTALVFVVLTCWASNIAVADTMHTQRYIGFLQKNTD
jgi:uncharacterized tellurite resistance protein B-like protein